MAILLGCGMMMHILEWILIIILLVSCSGPSKIQKVQAKQMTAEIGLVEQYEMVDQSREGDVVRPDTLVVQDAQGNEMILMKAIKDENGDMVATDVISAAVVEARFRNVAERHGKVDIAFQIRVPKEMQDEEWQLRFYPEMHIMEDTLHMDQVIITGAKYRKAQLRGYQQYEKFLASIVTDSTRFINMRQLELFIQRNIPDLYAFKVDSTEVADEHFNAILDTQVASSFASEFGVTGREAIEHYTNTISKHRNARRWERRNEMFEKYVRVPIVHEGLRLDTVITAENGDFVYNYVQTIATRPKLRKVDVVLSGDIYKQDKRLYEIPATEPLTYYISSLSAFVDGTPRYKKQIISRRVQANTACYIDFEQGSAEIVEDLSHNQSEMGRIKENLATLIENREFDLDSIVVTASCSPEGTMPFNTRLSQRRSEAVSRYFDDFIREYREEMRKEAETAYYFDSLDDEILRSAQNDSPEVRFISRSNPGYLVDRIPEAGVQGFGRHCRCGPAGMGAGSCRVLQTFARRPVSEAAYGEVRFPPAPERNGEGYHPDYRAGCGVYGRCAGHPRPGLRNGHHPSEALSGLQYGGGFLRHGLQCIGAGHSGGTRCPVGAGHDGPD